MTLNELKEIVKNESEKYINKYMYSVGREHNIYSIYHIKIDEIKVLPIGFNEIIVLKGTVVDGEEKDRNICTRLYLENNQLVNIYENLEDAQKFLQKIIE